MAWCLQLSVHWIHLPYHLQTCGYILRSTQTSFNCNHVSEHRFLHLVYAAHS